MVAPLNRVATNKIANAVAAGHTEEAAADIAGVSRSSVSRYKRDPKVRALIDKAQTRLAEAAPDIVGTDIAVINRAHKILAVDKYDTKAITLLKDTGLMDLYTKVSKRVGQAIGIFNTPAPSLFIQNLYQDNRSQTIAPNVLALISGGMTDPDDDETVDADYEIIE